MSTMTSSTFDTDWARPGSVLVVGSPRIISVHTVLGTENTFGAALTYHSAASLARLAIASSVVSAQCTNVNTPFWELTNLPTGPGERASPASYSASSMAIVSTVDRSVVASAPTPRSPAMANDAGVETVCHSRGCGCCSGLGTSVRGGIVT